MPARLVPFLGRRPRVPAVLTAVLLLGGALLPSSGQEGTGAIDGRTAIARPQLPAGQDSAAHRVRMTVRLTELEDGRISGRVRLPVPGSGTGKDTVRWAVRGLEELEARLIGRQETRPLAVRRSGPNRVAVPLAPRARADTSAEQTPVDTTAEAIGGSPGSRVDAAPDRSPGGGAARDTLELRFAGPAERIVELRRAGDGTPLAAWTRSVEVLRHRWMPRPLSWRAPRPVTLRFVHAPEMELAAPGRLVASETVADRTTTVYRLEEPVLPRQLGWAARPGEAVRRSLPSSAGRTVLLEYLVDPMRTRRAGALFREVGPILSELEAITGRPYPQPNLRIAVVPGLHVPSPPIAGVALVSDSLMSAPVPAGSARSRFALARTLARQWTARPLFPDAPATLREGWSDYLALRYLDRVGDSLHAGELLRRAERDLARPEQDLRAALRARGLWTAALVQRSVADLASWNEGEWDRRVDRVRALARLAPPRLEVAYRPGSGRDSLVVEVRRLPDTVRAPVDTSGAGSSLRFDLPLEIGTSSGALRTTVPVLASEATIRVPLSSTPDFLVVDPDNELPLPTVVRQPPSAHLAQLRRASTIEGRVQAAEALSRYPEDRALPIGIRGALEAGPSVPVERALLRTLGRLPAGGTRDALIRERLTDPRPTIRRAAVRALGRGAGDGLPPRLAMERARTDTSVVVQAAAVRAATRLEAPGWVDLVRSALVTDAPNELVRRAAFDALRIGELPAGEGLEPALTWSRSDRPVLLRAAAPAYLVQIGDASGARERLGQLLADRDERVRAAAAEALRGSEAPWAAKMRVARLPEEPHVWIRAVLEMGLEASTAD